jgi:hypothetical protein
MYQIISFYKPNKKKEWEDDERFAQTKHPQVRVVLAAPGDSYKTYKCKCMMQMVCFLIFLEDIVQWRC